MQTRSPKSLRQWRLLGAVFLATGLAIGCGGGGDALDSGVGSGGTGAPLSFSQGPINGFGSIVVNGVHFDDSTASVLDDDGNVLSNTASLRLGTIVDLQGGAVVAGTATASTIRVHTDLVGVVTAAYAPASATLVVLGQPVRVIATTALDGFAGGAVGIAAGSVVAVSSLYDASTGVYVASRIDPAPSPHRFAIRGAVQALDTTARTFTIGTDTFAYGNVAPPTPFANGQIVRVELQTARDVAGHWVVTSMGAGVTVPPDGRRGALEGVVFSATDATHFVVGGVTVDASQATVAPAGAMVVVRGRVEVQGTVVHGVLVATQVVVDADGDGQNNHGVSGLAGGDSFEIDGLIVGVVDTVHQTFTMRGPTTIGYAAASFTGGAASDLAQGKRVEVGGNLSPDGTEVIATRIKINP